MACKAFRRPCATQETSFMKMPIEGRKGGVHASCVAGHSPGGSEYRPCLRECVGSPLRARARFPSWDSRREAGSSTSASTSDENDECAPANGGHPRWQPPGSDPRSWGVAVSEDRRRPTSPADAERPLYRRSCPRGGIRWPSRRIPLPAPSLAEEDIEDEDERRGTPRPGARLTRGQDGGACLA